jgi:hypothetical protein
MIAKSLNPDIARIAAHLFDEEGVSIFRRRQLEEENEKLRAENARLKKLITHHARRPS